MESFRTFFALGAMLCLSNGGQGITLQQRLMRSISNSSLTQHGQLSELIALHQQTNTSDVAQRYSTYGCFCGFSGNQDPLDATDECCYQHKKCYADIQENGSETIEIMALVLGKYKYSFNEETNTFTCYSHSQHFDALREKCLCDKELVTCLSKNVNYPNYNHEFTQMDVIKDKCD